MTAQIIRLPVVRKRGRKVMKGPRAQVITLYQLPTATAPASAAARPLTIEERLEEALYKSALRTRRERAAMEADPKIIFFPEHRRVMRDEPNDAWTERGTAMSLMADKVAEKVKQRIAAEFGE